MKAVMAAITANLAVTVAKLIGWLFSWSPSMLAETIHSVIDTINQFLLYVGIRHSRALPSKMYPLGKGFARYIWNLVSAIGIFFVGFGFTAYNGIVHLYEGSEVSPFQNSYVSLVILFISFCAEFYSLTIAFAAVKELKEDKSIWEFIRTGDDPTCVAVLLEDTIAVLGVMVAFVGILLSQKTHSAVPDIICSIIIGILLGIMAILLAVANGRILMGMSADPDLEADIREFLEEYPSVERVANLRTSVLAPGALRVVAEVEFHGGILIDRQLIERDAERIREGEEPALVLFETAERTVRIVGREINKLELALVQEFPNLKVIDLEVN